MGICQHTRPKRNTAAMDAPSAMTCFAHRLGHGPDQTVLFIDLSSDSDTDIDIVG